MQKRLCGREQEFGMRVIPAMPKEPQNNSQFDGQPEGHYPGGHGHPSPLDSPRRRLNEEVIKAIIEIAHGSGALTFPSQGKVWLSNGASVYLDQDLLEFANAESVAGSLDGIVQEKVSEAFIEEAAKRVAENKGLKEFSFYKNTGGPQSDKNRWDEISYASHHNYSYQARKHKEVFRLIKHFIPISLPFTGSGHLGFNKNGGIGFILSQRARHIVVLKDSNTTTKRSLLNIREETLMHESSGLKRLHVIARDATRCETQTWLVDVMTHLVLRLAEEGWDLPWSYRLVDPLRELHAINFCLDENLEYGVLCGFSDKETAYRDLLECNEIYLNAAKQLSFLSEEEKRGLAEWQRILELLRARAFDKLAGELDWATKLLLLKNRMKKHGFGFNSVQAWRINMNYHNISSSPEKSWFARLDEAGYIKHLVSSEAIEKAKFEPPATRAKSRGDFIKLCLKHKLLSSGVDLFNWDSAIIGGWPDKIFFGEPDDPFATTSSSSEKLVTELVRALKDLEKFLKEKSLPTIYPS